MSTGITNRFALGIAAVSLLAGCGGPKSLVGHPNVIAPSAHRARSALTRGFGTVFAVTPSGKERVLHTFTGGSADGANPRAALLNVNGVLYGTTSSGGAYDGGTLFTIAPSGSETVLHSFGGSGDGADPMAALINVDGVLYGTTRNGEVENSTCAQGCGVVFSITPSGTETVVHTFQGYPDDGAYPIGDLLDVSGTLYGATKAGGSDSCGSGGSAGCGTVFAVTASGEESVLFSFGAKHDDCCPSAGLAGVNGTLYGTTVIHSGKVFKITASGDESPIHRFKGYPNDGAKPYGGLIALSDTLYGTTEYGGAHRRGTVFSVSTSGSETDLYSFPGGVQGGVPHASLLDVNGILYGTAGEGGASNRGVVFTITPSGTESVIYSFKGYPYDGETPDAGLIDVKGTLYGTTEYGAKE